MIHEINIDTARELLDFSGGKSSRDVAWEGQLRGAVALHNILVREKFAYLADEVGMGKTFVALGTVALFRHFNPGFRVLYITPRENIQDKWKKELLNFTANNWRITDNHVRSYQGTPAYRITQCSSLFDLAHQTMLDPNQDLILRMTSFSFGLSNDISQWTRKRDELLREVPFLKEGVFKLYDKERFKEHYARAINTVLPHFDLVVVDEAHNLKHGLSASSATRNRLIAHILGHPQGCHSDFPNYGMRYDRVLLLSATPLENDYRQLWNQLDLFNFGERYPVLIDPKASEYQKEQAAGTFLIRRLTGLKINGEVHTKNMYRREWRGGGVVMHDRPLQVPDDKQRLIVALVQKKVAEVISSDEFNNSFQIGMLASFESFMQTAKVARSDADEFATFDDTDQTTDDAEKEGIDVPSINKLAFSYLNTFGTSLPHPKMDAVAVSLRDNFDSGEKTLIFVRRVMSVVDLREKLNRYYDEWLRGYLLAGLLPAQQQEFVSLFGQYTEERKSRDDRLRVQASPDRELISSIQADPVLDDEGDNDNFFAWFFRGEGPKGVFSGAAFNRNRLVSEGSAYSTLFEDNYVTWLMGESGSTPNAIAVQLGLPTEETAALLRSLAYAFFRHESKQQEFRRKRVFEAYQKAALMLLSERASNLDLRHRAQIVLRERFNPPKPHTESPPSSFPEPDEHLATRTVFTELVKRPALCKALWPEEADDDFARQFRRRDQRRELLSAAARLGHPLIDLWLLAAKRLDSLRAGAQDRTEDRASELIRDYLDLLEQQQAQSERLYTAYRELAEIASHFDLIIAVNFPEIRTDRTLDELRKYFGAIMARQTPVGGMYGGVNKSMVRQFRMPGYPLILVTTEVLQEGEDLHTFCSHVVHYGISWTPSSMEQRTGRIDRIHSQTQRRLDNRDSVHPDELLQVYYPHLTDTVERLQVERVYERMNRFIRMMHRNLAGERVTDSRVSTLHDFVLPPRDIEPITEPIQTAYPVKEEWLRHDLPLERTNEAANARAALAHFAAMIDALETAVQVQRQTLGESWAYAGTVYVLPNNQLVAPGGDTNSVRQQPLRLTVRSMAGNGHLILRCISPIGTVEMSSAERAKTIQDCHTRVGFGKLCAAPSSLTNTVNLSIQADLLFHPTTTQVLEVIDLVTRTACSADALEQHLLPGNDQAIEAVNDQLAENSDG